MPSKVKQIVRYWAFLAGKFVLSFAIFASLIHFLNLFWAGPSAPVANRYHTLGYDRYLVYLICLGAVYMIGVALFYLSILDQRYRCRVCLRRLRMPIETGSWSKMLQFGRPHIQYICVYGHGKLNIPELHLTGTDVREWTQHDDYWAELCSVGERNGAEKKPGRTAGRSQLTRYQGFTPTSFFPNSVSTAGSPGSGSSCTGNPRQQWGARFGEPPALHPLP